MIVFLIFHLLGEYLANHFAEFELFVLDGVPGYGPVKLSVLAFGQVYGHVIHVAFQV